MSRARAAARRLIGAALVVLAPSVAHAQASPSDYTYATRYDAARRVTGTIAPDPDGAGPLHYAAVRNSYDLAGRLIRTEKGELQDWPGDAAPVDWGPAFVLQMQVDTSYDAMGRKTLEVTSGGGTAYTATQYSYNDQGLLECTAVRMNPAVYGSQPASACTLGTDGGQGPDRITRNDYDAAGQLLKVQKAYGVTGLQQDYATYTYSPNGKRTSVRDANGNLATMTYDGFDRQATWMFPSATTPGQSSGSDYEEYGYDPNGNRTSLRKRDGRVLTFAYDALNRMTAKIVPEGCAPIQVGGCAPAAATRDVYYGYDLRGLQTYARFDGPTGEGVDTAYDGFGQLAGSTTAMAGTSRAIGYQYDADGNRIQITTPGGIWSYGYDGLDRLAGLYEGAGTTVTLSLWSYDARGLPASVAERYGSGVAWSYDPIGRLAGQSDTFGGGTGNVVAALAYNPAGQLVSRGRDNESYAFTGYVNVNRGYVVNGLNQYTSAGPATFQYDANGNLVADGTNGYVFDAENRLVGASNGAVLGYDPLGRLFQVAGTAAGTTQLLYDGDQLTAEYDGAGTLTERYVHGPGDDDPLVWYPAGGDWLRWYHRDHQGSIVALANGPSGALLAIDAYDEYGIPKAGNTGRFQYTGQTWIPELGMYHYKARLYSPTLGRFLQTDPIGYDDQVNLYAYVGNDPVNGRDPTGMKCNKENTLCEADTFKPERSNGKTVAGTPAMDAAATSAAPSYAVTGGGDTTNIPETLGFGVAGADGSITSTPGSATTSSDATHDQARATPPSGALFTEHGHVDGQAAGMVDQTRGLGDSQSVSKGLPNYVVSEGRLGVRELVGGRLQQRMVQGSLSRAERSGIMSNLNRQQRFFLLPKVKK